MELQGYWMDVGQPKDFIIGATLYLEHSAKHRPDILCKNESCLGRLEVERQLVAEATTLFLFLSEQIEHNRNLVHVYRECVSSRVRDHREKLPDWTGRSDWTGLCYRGW